MKDLIRAVLLHRQLPQTKWRTILPALIFALNASPSKATKCVPYNVVFGRNAVLPEDILFKNQIQYQYDNITPGEYEHATSCSLQDIFLKVVDALKISKLTMRKHYNKNLRFTDYTPGQQVWLKVKHYKTGENRKLALRRDGPWTIVNKLPNGVNLTSRVTIHKRHK